MLPSEQTAITFLERGLGAALPGMIQDLAERSTLIGVGLWLAGQRQNLVRLSVAGALVVEVAVLVWVARSRRLS